MAARRDDSMLFSLDGLRGAERERLERELRSHRLAAATALARTEAKQRAAREAELERGRRAMLEAERRKEEEIRAAALAEAARSEAALRERLELLEQQHEHERRMLALRGHGQRGTQLAVAGLGAALLCLAGSLGVYFGKLRPETQRVQRAYDDLVHAERTRAEETKRMLAQSERRRAELASELAGVRRRVAELEGKSAGPAK